MKILIPSDNRDFVTHWVEAYRRAGCEVVTGLFNFDLKASRFDLVHFQWPEEFCEWVPPTERRLEQVVELVNWWSERSKVIVSVNNLWPHGFERNDRFRSLFNAFYARSDVIHHFSNTSERLVRDEFEGAAGRRHIVTQPFNYESLLKCQNARKDVRTEFGFRDDDFVILVMGAIRQKKELDLVTRAIRFCGDARVKLLYAGRYSERCGWLQRRIRQLRWRLWLLRTGGRNDERYIPDEELYRYMDSSNVVVIPRTTGLSSGIPSLAMTFGKMVIAPRHGAFPEYLEGTRNLLYETGSVKGLAEAITIASKSDFRQIGQENQ
jgi:glycosyltransferase involved in cell wall biosynthesis